MQQPLVDPYVVCGKNTHAMTTGGSMCGLWKEHTCNDHWLIHKWFVEKKTHAMTLVDPYVIQEKNTHAMTLVDPYVVCEKNTHAMTLVVVYEKNIHAMTLVVV